MIVLVGGGLASARAAQTLRAEGYDGHITIVGDEVVAPYHRPPLSKAYLGQSVELDIVPAEFYRTHGIELRLGRRAASIDVTRRHLVLDQGERLAFEQIFVATGAAPYWPPWPGIEFSNVLPLRSIDDAQLLRNRLGTGPRVVVVGGGLLGLEIAASIRRLGHTVTVLEAAAWPLARLIRSEEVGKPVVALHRDHGVDLRTSVHVRGILGAGAVEAVELDGGERIACDLVVLALGVRPTTGWLEGSPVRLDDGVLVDAGMRTNVPNVFAGGDVARAYHPLYDQHQRVEQYGHAAAQAAVAARNMLGRNEVVLAAPAAGSEQFDNRIQIVGRLRGGEEAVVLGDTAAYRFSVAFVADGRLRAVFAMNRPRDVLAARKLVETGMPVDRDAMARAQQIV